MAAIHVQAPDGRTGMLNDDGSFTPDVTADAVSGGSTAPVQGATVPPPSPAAAAGVQEDSPSPFTDALRTLGQAAKTQGRYISEDVNALGSGMMLGARPAINAAIMSLVNGSSFEDERKKQKALDEARQDQLKTGGNYVGRALEATGPAVTAAALPGGVALQSALMGGGQAVGEGVSAGKSAPEIAKDVAIQAPVAAVAGKAGDMAINSMINGAGAKAVDWVSRELLGTDAATAVRGGMLPSVARNAAAVEKVAAAEPEIANMVSASKSGDQQALAALRDKTESLLKVEREARPERFAALDANEPIKVGDIVGKLDAAADAMPAGDKAAEDGLRAWSDRLKAKWGKSTKPGALEGEALSREIAPGFTVGDAVNNYKNIFENPSNYVKENPNAVELAQQGLKELTERYGTKPSVGYDPDKIVPSKDLRDFVTDMQRDKIAAASKDFAPSVREEIKSKIAEPAQKFLDDYIDRAASKGPEIAKLADEYRASNERMRGLITINDVADQRLGLARTNSLAGKTPMMSPVTKAIAGSGVTGLVAGAASGHVAPAAVIAGAGLAAAGGKALAERALISLIRAKAAGSVTAAMVEQAIRSGVPRAAALAASGLTQYARGQ